MSHAFDSKALELSRKTMGLMYGPMPVGGSCQLHAQIQNLFIEAMQFAAPAVQAEQPGNTEHVEPVSAANKLGGWIPVSERMPKQTQSNRYMPLNLLLNFRTVVQGGYDDESFWIDGERINNVTHWMPLPAAPKQEAE